MRIPVVICAIAGSLASIAGFAVAMERDPAPAPTPNITPASLDQPASGSIPEVAAAAGKFGTLLAAVKAAGLAEALSGPGPFTVFAPTDDAFKALGMDRVETLLRPENRDRLTDILKYHVVPARVAAADFLKLTQATTLDGQRIIPSVDDGQLRVNKSTIIATDIAASNGIIHVIDRVLVPARENIATTAKEAGHFKTLLAAVKAADLVDALGQPGPYTVFAPTDDAFAKLPKGTVESLLRPENRNQLQQILKLHVIPARVYARDAAGAGSAATLAGEALTIAADSGRLTVRASNTVRIVKTDVDASNGVIHVIDGVLLPQAAAAMTAAPITEGPAGILRLAISRGVPLFNDGNPAACAAIYEIASRGVADLPSSPPKAREALRQGLNKAANSANDSDRAWALREAIDEALRLIDAEAPTANPIDS